MNKILIVDDATFIRVTLKQMLEANGLEVIGEAGNGKEAIEKFKILQPDLVTMDITMPEMDGIQALSEIMAYDPKAKVVMLSAMGQEALVKKSILLGAKTFIVKPFNQEHILKTLTKILNI